MRDDKVEYFLITYDIAAGASKVESFGQDYESALKAYDEVENAARDDENLDIVLVGAEDLDVVKRTHSSYFETGNSLESLLPDGILS